MINSLNKYRLNDLVLFNLCNKTLNKLKNKKATIYRAEHFNAAHRLNNPNWSEEKNNKVFGKCNNEFYHGHNYELIIKVTGDIDHETGYVIDTKLLSDLIKTHVLNQFDHKNLNEQVPQFKDLNPTAENIAVVIYEILREKIDNKLEIQIRLYETPRNFVEFPVD